MCLTLTIASGAFTASCFSQFTRLKQPLLRGLLRVGLRFLPWQSLHHSLLLMTQIRNTCEIWDFPGCDCMQLTDMLVNEMC
mmetsp:Transcript_30552/g.50590  ORF Transcript_30552/g.50590 Transcript_30552/m.50590 type:complete len:81 (-) Transcript_30552:307-549(-)